LHGRLEKQQVRLEISDAARSWFASEGYDPVFGARPLKRFIQQHVESPVARLLIAGDAISGDRVAVDVENGELTLRAKSS
jgi:ATP-dependent Clp protease ATP-binding subunit ClpB